MNYSIYETISSKDRLPVNAFVISLDSVNWHWHKEYEFLSILSGEMTLNVQSEEYVLKTGDMVLINPKEIHALRKNSGECLCMVVQMAEALFSFNEPDEEEEILHFYVNSTEDEAPQCGYGLLYYRLAKIVYESLADSHISNFRIRAQVCSLIADLMEFSVYDKRIKARDTKDQQNLLIEIINYLEENLMDENVLDSTCRKYGISRKTLDRTTDSVLDISAKDLVDNLRLEKAKKLLKYSTKSIGYIMDVCGFVSENTFYRNFKRFTGVTPKEYRDSIKREDDQVELKGYLDYETPRVLEILKEIVKAWENRNHRQ